jgi:hypothetical protein
MVWVFMTLVDRLIPYMFWLEWGIGKLGLYVSAITLGLMIITTLTVKGIYIPVWAFVPIGVAVIATCMFYGWVLDSRNVMARMTSHLNKRGNPEWNEMVAAVERIEKKLIEIEQKVNK